MKVPRDISGKEAVRALKRLGFDFADQRGSHIRLAKGSIRITVPNHNAILPKNTSERSETGASQLGGIY